MKAASAHSLYMTSADWALLGVLALLWGGSFFAMEIILTQLDSLSLVFWRVVPAAAALGAFAWWRIGPPPLSWRFGLISLLFGALNNFMPFLLIAWGQEHIEGGLASIFNATTAFWSVLTAHLFTSDEKATPRKLLGVSLGVLGVAIVMGLAALNALDLRSLGQLAIVGAAWCYAFAAVPARRLGSSYGGLWTAAAMLTGAAICSGVGMAVFQRSFAPSLSAEVWAAVLYLSLISTAVAYMLYFILMRRAGSSNTMLVTLLVAPVAIALGALFLGESIAPQAWVGFGFIALGLIVIDGRADGWLARRGGAYR